MIRPELTQCAADLFRARQRRARQAFGRGAVSRLDAERLLRPWLAIACLAWADLPELVEPLALLREAQRFPGGGPVQLDEASARMLLASDLCPPLTWAAALAQARDKALDDLPAANAPADQLTRARHLIALAAALQVTTPYHPRPAPPFTAAAPAAAA